MLIIQKNQCHQDVFPDSPSLKAFENTKYLVHIYILIFIFLYFLYVCLLQNPAYRLRFAII